MSEFINRYDLTYSEHFGAGIGVKPNGKYMVYEEHSAIVSSKDGYIKSLSDLLEARDTEVTRLERENTTLQEQVKNLTAENTMHQSFLKQLRTFLGGLGTMAIAPDIREQIELGVSRMKSPTTEEVLRSVGNKAVKNSDDKKRMDWLCAHCVEVRSPQMYGSHAMFHAQQDSEEWDLPHHTTLREQVDAAMSMGEQS